MHIILTAAFFMLTSAVFAQHYKITVTVIGLHSDKGKVYLSLYNTARGYPKEPSAAYRLSSAVIVKRQCTIILDDIPKGAYAIACFHDENNNGKLDKNFLGIPVEGTGASNNARGSWGPPRFQNAQFRVNNDISQTIGIVY